MGPKKTAVMYSRKLTLYTVNLAPPGGKFKFLICFCLLKPPGASNQKSCFMQSNAKQSQILHCLRAILYLPLAKAQISNLEVPNGNGRLF